MESCKLALIGYPLGHSLSPILYKTAFNDLDIKGEYEILPTQSEELITQIKYLRTHKYYGFNVTIPHKVPVTLFLSKYDEQVNMTGSVNVVKIEEDSSLSGFNTDVWGFFEAIPKDVDLKRKKAAVIGTGGAARAVCAGLYMAGIKKIDIYTRNVLDSTEVIKTLRNRFDKIKFNGKVHWAFPFLFVYRFRFSFDSRRRKRKAASQARLAKENADSKGYAPLTPQTFEKV